MRNKKGFTLIELLAVIVILAIIALVAVPMVLSTIESAKKGATESSAYAYVEAVENAIATYMLENNASEPTSIDDLRVEVKGDAPKSKTVCLANGVVSEASLEYENYKVYYDGTKAYVDNDTVPNCSSSTPSTPTYVAYTTGNEILYDPTTGTSCTSVGGNCMRFYAIEDSDASKSTVDAILDHNTTATVAWNSSGNNADGMNEVATALVTDTQGWQGSPRLITANEVARITGNTGFDASQTGMGWFCLDTNAPDDTNYCAKAEGTSAYKWLFDNTKGCTSYGCDIADDSTYGYWTSTPYAGGPSRAWYVYRNGYLNYSTGGYVSSRGVRPVITISKSIIS